MRETLGLDLDRGVIDAVAVAEQRVRVGEQRLGAIDARDHEMARQRDAALSRVEEVQAGREAMVDQFRLLANEVAEQKKAKEATKGAKK